MERMSDDIASQAIAGRLGETAFISLAFDTDALHPQNSQELALLSMHLI
jgi:hypothetical protein